MPSCVDDYHPFEKTASSLLLSLGRDWMPNHESPGELMAWVSQDKLGFTWTAKPWSWASAASISHQVGVAYKTPDSGRRKAIYRSKWPCASSPSIRSYGLMGSCGWWAEEEKTQAWLTMELPPEGGYLPSYSLTRRWPWRIVMKKNPPTEQNLK